MLKLLLPEGTIVSQKIKMVRRMRSRAMVRMNSKKAAGSSCKPSTVQVKNLRSSTVQFRIMAQEKIVRVTTYGKGVVQQLLDLGDGTCFKVTIAEYYTQVEGYKQKVLNPI